MTNILDTIEKSRITRKPNYRKIPVTAYPFTEEGIQKFNEVYKLLMEQCKEYNPIKHTRSGGISYDHIRLPQWEVRALKSCIEITVLGTNGFFRVQLRTLGSHEDGAMSGSKCFTIFRNMLAKDGVDITEYAIENGREVKDTIPKLPIGLYRPSYRDRIYNNVHHIDLNSSFFAGIADAFPAFRPTVQKIYNFRKNSPSYKHVLTHTQGYMQSTIIGCKYAHISKAGIESNNKKIEYLTKKLIEQDFVILMYNTDGIWYTSNDNRMYHDSNEGKALGQWKHDHVNCKWQAKSNGAYHYIEDGVCHTVLRGSTNLDRVKPREQWTWDDLYNHDTTVMKIRFIEGKGAEIHYEDAIV